MTAGSAPPLLEVRDLVKHFPGRGRRAGRSRTLRAVDGVSFSLAAGETLGLVGESGSGKTTVSRLLMGLERPTAGSVLVEGRDVFAMSRTELMDYRRQVQMVFQDPFGSLNERMTAYEIVAEPWEVHRGVVARPQRRLRAGELMELVGLDPDLLHSYPGQLSGGQRQRLGIARALALQPRILICDEPVSALDVSVQAQVLTLLADLQRELGVASIFIAHDLSVVYAVAGRLAVMYLGRIVECGPAQEVYATPRHPFTRALLSAIPDLAVTGSRSERRRIVLEGEIPSPTDPPSACRFRTRCWLAEDRCAVDEPELRERDGRLVACHLPVGAGAR